MIRIKTTIRRVLLFSKEATTSATTIHHHNYQIHYHHSTLQRNKNNFFLFNNNNNNNMRVNIRRPRRYLGMMTASITTTFLSATACWPIATICGFQQQQQQHYFSNFPSSSSSSSSSSIHRVISSTARYYSTMDNNGNEKEIATESSSSSEEEEESTTNNNNNINNFATSYHAPVMWKECIDSLLDCQRSKERQIQNNNDKSTSSSDSSDSSLIFIDGTLGGGGHTAALLEKLQPGDIVIGCDVDPMALQTASERLKDYIVQDDSCSPKTTPNHGGPYFIPVQTNFGNLISALRQVKHPITQQPIMSTTAEDDDDGGGGGGVDGILLDLGVSSFQIDTPERGFAFMKDGPLDMRMNNNNNDNKGGGLTASDICNEFDQTELQRIFSQYGDEPKSKTIARAIINHRPIVTTKQLTDAIASVTPKFVKRNKRMGQTATFARIFQSLRIVVNNEDGVLRQVFEDACPTLLRQGGRLVVLSYHSMEDRATKRIMRDGSIDATSKSRRRQQDQRDIYGNYIGPKKPFKPIGKRQKATEEEINQNSRARSASLRIAERQ